jgi:FkbM family methyltransferase
LLKKTLVARSGCLPGPRDLPRRPAALMTLQHLLLFLRPPLQAWTPDQHVKFTDDRYTCSPGKMQIAGYPAHNMCLLQQDWISSRIRKLGRWPDCDMLVKLWNIGRRHSDDARGLFIDVGANIGACTIEVLIRTNASVVAFEPNPKSLFYLQQSLVMLTKTLPDVARRVAVFPFALGSTYAHNVSMFAVQGNQGNAVLGVEVKDRASDKTERTQNIMVRRLDDIFTKFVHVRLMKLDVQGYECEVLRGAGAVLGNVKSISVEADARFLRAQGCGTRQLRDTLTASGFNVSTQRTLTEDTFTGVRQRMIAKR